MQKNGTGEEMSAYHEESSKILRRALEPGYGGDGLVEVVHVLRVDLEEHRLWETIRIKPASWVRLENMAVDPKRRRKDRAYHLGEYVAKAYVKVPLLHAVDQLSEQLGVVAEDDLDLREDALEVGVSDDLVVRRVPQRVHEHLHHSS
jgi:hypothetical protein